ncbi:MAG TPA: HD domain-containing protein [Pirellulaceae bacterium]|nr:HD domain-containing protein [Pirellulaceae bacterium]
MDRQQLLSAAAAFVRDHLAGDSSGHDWWHIDRVRSAALAIAREERADLFVVELAALLHDVDDWKLVSHRRAGQAGSASADPPEPAPNHGGPALARPTLRVGARSLFHPTLAQEWMEVQQVEPVIIEHVCRIIGELSFKGAGVATPMTSLEGQCVQDADRLDALGAVGIGRTFAYGGHTGQPMHDPELSPTQHESFEAYKSNVGTTINHFYEKLLLLKDRMNTAAAKNLAAGRHAYMEQFLAQFLAEWEGRR